MANHNALNGIYNGLTSTYSALASQYKDGVTAENILEAQGKVTTNGTNTVKLLLLSH